MKLTAKCELRAVIWLFNASVKPTTDREKRIECSVWMSKTFASGIEDNLQLGNPEIHDKRTRTLSISEVSIAVLEPNYVWRRSFWTISASWILRFPEALYLQDFKRHYLVLTDTLDYRKVCARRYHECWPKTTNTINWYFHEFIRRYANEDDKFWTLLSLPLFYLRANRRSSSRKPRILKHIVLVKSWQLMYFGVESGYLLVCSIWNHNNAEE